MNAPRPVYVFAGYFYTPAFALLCVPHLMNSTTIPPVAVASDLDVIFVSLLLSPVTCNLLPCSLYSIS